MEALELSLKNLKYKNIQESLTPTRYSALSSKSTNNEYIMTTSCVPGFNNLCKTSAYKFTNLISCSSIKKIKLPDSKDSVSFFKESNEYCTIEFDDFKKPHDDNYSQNKSSDYPKLVFLNITEKKSLNQITYTYNRCYDDYIRTLKYVEAQNQLFLCTAYV